MAYTRKVISNRLLVWSSFTLVVSTSVFCYAYFFYAPLWDQSRAALRGLVPETQAAVVVEATDEERLFLNELTFFHEWLRLRRGTVTHTKTPEAVKGIYMTSWVAGLPEWRGEIVDLIEKTELNAVIIDIKDDTGRVSFKADSALTLTYGSVENRIPDLGTFISEMHARGIYVVGRIAVFQDPWMTKQRPDLAVKFSDGTVWEDRKGLSWIDVGARDHWEYIAELARASEKIGFDEINFDYVRFPTDGATSNMVLPFTGEADRSDALDEFFEWITTDLDDLNIPLSVDLFGMTTSVNEDMGIGQILEDALYHFDYVMPMVYPSHYPDGWRGFADPNDYPGQVIKAAMQDGVDKALAAQIDPDKLRPWLQDFDYGGDYGPAEVRAQIDATYETGLDSWFLWDPNVRYTPSALYEN